MKEQNNIPVDLNEKELFIKYLNDYEVAKKNIKIAEKIDFKGICSLFDKNFDELWERINSKKGMIDLQQNHKEFKEKILFILRQSIFNILYIGIKDLKAKDIVYDELNRGILGDFEKIMKNFFSAFKTEYELLNPSKNIKKDIEVKSEKVKEKEDTVEKPVKKEKPPKKVIEINYKPEDIQIYKKVLHEFDKIDKKDESISLRKIALSIAETELGIKDKNELQSFYKSFIKYKRKVENG